MNTSKIQKITPFLWFEKEAEEAAKYYVSIFGEIFGDSEITAITHYDKASSEVSGQPEGSVMMVTFKLAGQEFAIMNGGKLPEGWTKISGSVSFMINCETQKEIDYFWEKLSEGGKKSVCGWIESDKFGVTWQVTPTILSEILTGPDKEKAARATKAMLKMTKIEIDKIQNA